MCHSPCSIWNAVTHHEIFPCINFCKLSARQLINVLIIGARRQETPWRWPNTPFSDKQWSTHIQSLLRGVTQRLTMRANIEMQGVRNVAAPDDRISGRLVNTLRPYASSNSNQVIGIYRSNRVNDICCIGLNYRAPIIGIIWSLGFVIDLVNNVRISSVGACHFLKERNRCRFIIFSMMSMPIDNHIHIVGDCSIDNGFDPRFVGRRFL